MNEHGKKSWWERTESLDTQWMSKSLCVEIGPDLFFIEQGGAYTEAKQICQMCSVTSECLTWALAQPGIGGFLGGTTEHQRRRMGRQAS